VTDLGVSRPTIRPSLLLDFANTEALDPRITFARASTARYYNGVTTAKAEENLLIRSQDYSATWTVTNLTPVTGKTAPDATSTATEFTASAANAVLTQGYTAIAGSYTFSVFLRRVTGSGDIQIAADNGTWTTKVITGTWARYDVTQTVAAGSKTAGVRVVTSTDAIEVWGAQLEQRSAVTAYTPTTTQPITNYVPVLLSAANNVARFDHNPVTGESLGLLIEEQRTNLLTYSEQFDDAAWVKSALNISANTAVAPDGTLSADGIVPTTASAAHFLDSIAISFTSGTAYTQSVYAKALGTAGYRLRLRFNAAAFTSITTADFDLVSGTVTGTSGTITATITPVGNGWYRCTATATATATASSDIYLLILSSNGTQTHTGDGFSGALLWGAQLEAGAFPTSYIATVASAVTRSADAASMTGANFSSWFNNAEGTLYAEASPQTSNALGYALFEVNDATATNRIGLFKLVTTGNASMAVRTGDVTQVSTNNGAWPSSGKLAGAYAVNDFSSVLNGGAAATDTSGTLPLVTQAIFGARGDGANRLTGTIRKIAYYPKRLTNAELQGLTS
jgi:hypothetical protein